MFKFYLLFLGSVFAVGRCSLRNDEALPSWITNNEGYKNYKAVNSTEAGCGSLTSKEKGNAGWVVTLNKKAGHGVEIELEKLSMDPDKEEFLMVSPWPLAGNFKRIKLYTGKFSKPLKNLRIPNTKTFFILYSASQSSASPEMVLKYRRYGSPLEIIPPPTEDPTKKKQTLYEIQLRGKAPEEYQAEGFLNQVKEAIRASAKRFSAAHNITFNDSNPTSKMVLIRRISFCPFEWPDRDICASIEHSVFVSGKYLPDQEIIIDYELVAENLKKMWDEDDFPELRALGITVYHLPSTSNIALYWSLIIGLVLISSLIIVLILRKIIFTHTRDIRSRRISLDSEVIMKIKRPKLKLHKHQRVPSFIYNERHPQLVQLEKQLQKEISEQNALRETPKDVSRTGAPPQAPIGNYVASVIFGSNKAFDDDEDDTVEFRKKTHL